MYKVACKKYATQIGHATLWYRDERWCVNGVSGDVETELLTDDDQLAEEVYKLMCERIYEAPAQTKDQVKLGLSPATKVTEL